MFQIILEHKLLTGLMILFLLLSIICQIIAGVIFQSMIVETDNMSATKNKLLKQCKQKYANYYKLNGKMANTGVFVDKFLQKICFAKIYLVRLAHLAGQLMMLFILVVGVSICYSLAAGNTLFQIIPYYLISILGLYSYFSISGLMDIQEKKNILKTNLMDYLENHFVPRLEVEKELVWEEETLRKKVQSNNHEPLCVKKENIALGQRKRAIKQDKPEYMEELESLLEEFFA